MPGNDGNFSFLVGDSLDGISTGIIGLFIGTWTWIATLTYKVGRINGDIKDKVDLMFAKMFKDTDNGEIEELRNKIIEARKRLTNVEISDGILLLVAKLCLFLQVDGHRPDIIITMVAKTIAALFGRNYVEPEDVKVAAKLVLGHRTRRGGFLEPATPQEIEVAFDRVLKGIKLKSEKRDKSAKRDIKALLSGRGTGIPSSGNIESLELKGRDTRIPISGFGKPDLREEIEGRIPKETDIPIPQRDREKSKKKSRLGLGKLKDFFREIFSTNRIQEQRQRF